MYTIDKYKAKYRVPVVITTLEEGVHKDGSYSISLAGEREHITKLRLTSINRVRTIAWGSPRAIEKCSTREGCPMYEAYESLWTLDCHSLDGVSQCEKRPHIITYCFVVSGVPTPINRD